MALNPYINKVVKSDGTVLIDLTTDTAVEAKVLDGYTFHKATGETVEGTCTYDADTSDATATHGEILNTKTAYVNGVKVTGDMPNIGAQTGYIATKAQSVGISAGYHDGSGSVSISSVEQAKILEGNIKSGVEILGVLGTYTGEAITARVASATPSWQAQTILPGTGYDYLSEVDIAAIPYAEVDNAAGGKTVTIGPSV